ncbi:MAG: hypothetical protein GY874_23370 [Desulfobacteraceae bacterium]|nr:hypothetical protein [Desulfobacteraceae bacterium]
MDRQNQLIPFVFLLFIAALIQVAMIAADCYQSPARVAKEFTKAYFYLDEDMQNYLCKSLAADGEAADNYLYQKQYDSGQRGLSSNYVRHLFTKMHLEIVDQSEKLTKVHVKGTTRVAINPVYMVIGKLFFIGKDHHVDTILELVKEEGGWKVCNNPFGLIGGYENQKGKQDKSPNCLISMAKDVI